jgi:hypothetical protein
MTPVNSGYIMLSSKMEGLLIDCSTLLIRSFFHINLWYCHVPNKNVKQHAKTKKIDNEFFLFNGADIF